MAEADIERVLFTREAIEGRVSELGKLIAEDFAGRREGPIVLGILKGAYSTDLAVALALDSPQTLDPRHTQLWRPSSARSPIAIAPLTVSLLSPSPSVQVASRSFPTCAGA